MNEIEVTGQMISDQLAVAMLAAQFLPKIELPEGWQSKDAFTLRNEIEKASAYPYSNPSTGGDESPFEVIACEAVKRAEIVLREVAGLKREAVILKHQFQGEVSQMRAASSKEKDEAMREFDERFKGTGTTQSLPNVLEGLLGKRRSKSVVLFAWNLFINNEVGGRWSNWVYCDGMKTPIDREGYALIKATFTRYFEDNKDDIIRQHQRDKGSKGGRKAQDTKRAGSGVHGLTKRDAIKLDTAAAKAKKPQSVRKRSRMSKEA